MEAQIHILAESSECMRKELQELRQNVQEILQFSKLKQGLNVKTPKVLRPLNGDVYDFTVMGEHFIQSQKDYHGMSFQLQSADDHFKAQNRQTLKHMRHLCESIKASSGHKENRKTRSVPDDQMSPEKCSLTIKEVRDNHPALHVSTVRKEEAELRELVEKLKDALSLQIKPGLVPDSKQELLHAVGHVCRWYSNFINNVTEPTSC